MQHSFEGVKKILFGYEPVPDRSCWCKKGFVYRNLHETCFSVRCYCTASQKGRVILHLNQVYMQDVVFKVSEAGRQRVLSTHQKNVHAGIQGSVCYLEDPSIWRAATMKEAWMEITYNPYQMNQFQTREGVPVRRAKKVYLESTGSYLAHGIE